VRTIILILLLLSELSFPQWNIVHPFQIPITGQNYTSIDFVDSLNGWTATNKGIVIHTTDGGRSWINQSTGITSIIRKIRFADSMNGWAVGDSGKIIHTTNGGGSWTIQNSIASMKLTMLSVVNSQNVWAAGTWGSTQQDILLHTTTGGNSWNTVTPNLSTAEHISDMMFINENKGWYCTWQYISPFTGGGVFVTSNGGQSWNRQLGVAEIQSAIFFVDDNYGWSVGDWSVCRTTTGGISWSASGTFSNKYFSDVCFVDRNIGWLIEVTYYGGYFNNNVIHFSYNGGQNFTPQFTAATDYKIYDMDVVEKRIGWAALVSNLGAGGYLLHTKNGGGVFPSPPNLLSPEDGTAVNNDTVYFSWSSSIPNVSGYTLSLSNDSLFTASIDTFVTGASVQIINLNPNQKYYWKVKALNSLGYGAYSRTNSFVTNLTTIEEELITLNFELDQNYPNPFNPSTRIQYAISSRQFVTLQVYDVLGNEVATLVNEDKAAGNYEVEFGAKNLSSGIYFYQLKAGAFVQSMKMILLR
jgi:photosystem II stability/assembly factor-like uncharacterized protein